MLEKRHFMLALLFLFWGGMSAGAATLHTNDGGSTSGTLEFTTSGSVFVKTGGNEVAQLKKSDLTPGSIATVEAWEASNTDLANLSTKFDSRPQPVTIKNPERTRDLESLSGIVVLAVVVNASGAVEEAFVKDSSEPRFNGVSVDALRSWSFTPITVASQPSRGIMFVPLQY